MTAMTPVLSLYCHADANPDQVALIAGADIWTYRRLAAGVDRLARSMTVRGIRPGDRVALHMLNRPELVLAYFACFRIGAIAAPLQAQLTACELRLLLLRLRPAMYIGECSLYPRVAKLDEEILGHGSRYVVGGRAEEGALHWDDLLRKRDGGAVPDFPDIQFPSVLLPTSGTTGIPKLAAHSALSLNASVDAAMRMGLQDHRPVILAASSSLHAIGFQSLIMSIRLGATAVLLERFNPDAALDAIERQCCTWMMGFPFMYADLVRGQRSRVRAVDSLRFCVSSGEVCPPQLQQDFARVFGLPLRSVWSATEVVGTLIHGSCPGTVGRSGSRSQVTLVDEDGGPVKHGAVGELCVRGPNVAVGYWSYPGSVRSACVDSWFRTGDLMKQGSGDEFWFVGRLPRQEPACGVLRPRVERSWIPS